MAAKILIVDDEPDALRMMETKVRRHFPSCTILTAPGGAAGLELARTEMPALVLLDAKMPDLNGFQVCEQLTSDPATSHIFVLLFTAYYDDIDHRIAGFESGAVGFICKPFREEELVSQIRAIIRFKKAEESLREAEVAARQASDAKSALLSGMSHEFRTPLNAVVGFAEALDDEYFGALNEKQKSYVRYILEAGRRLAHMVDGVLDVANIGADPSSLDIQPVRVGDMVERSMELVRERCVKQGILLRKELPADTANAIIHADPRKLRQVLFLLLSNAAKFSSQGGTVTVTARRGSDQLSATSDQLTTSPLITDHRSPITSPAWLEISVADEGIGIGRENLERVFTEFFQERNGLADKTPGIGVSLSLVKRLVEAHGGRIWAESEGRNKGSTFRLTVPIGKGANAG